jgi:hypothetical protein
MTGRPAVAKPCGWSVGGLGRGWLARRLRRARSAGAGSRSLPIGPRGPAGQVLARLTGDRALLSTPGAAIRSRAAHRLASAAGVLVSGRRGMLRVEMPPSALDPCSTSGGGRGRPRPSRRNRRIGASPRLSRTTPRDERTAVPGAQPRPWSRARHGPVAPSREPCASGEAPPRRRCQWAAASCSLRCASITLSPMCEGTSS